MRRALLISALLVLTLVGWNMVSADDGFYVIPTMKGNYAPVPKTGQTDPYGLIGTDGALQKGVAWPAPRFTDNNNGTVTDNLTKLIWTKNANAFGTKTWSEALNSANNLKSGDAGLTDGSQAGDWRLPNRRELFSLVDDSTVTPALPAGHPFTNVQSSFYWSSSTYTYITTDAWGVNFLDGHVDHVFKDSLYYVWCVRAGP